MSDDQRRNRGGALMTREEAAAFIADAHPGIRRGSANWLRVYARALAVITERERALLLSAAE